MLSRIEHISGSSASRPTSRAVARVGDQPRPLALPAPAGGAARVNPAPPVALGGDAEFAAQVMGQDGQRRGLRGGPRILDDARVAYNRVQWSGNWDRRARSGRRAESI
jgi:hypothetical protein